MTSLDARPDPPLTPEQRAIVEALSAEQVRRIDAALRANCRKRWRKVAAIVAFAMTDLITDDFAEVPDVYYAMRIRTLVERGLLESSGNLDSMRYSEVRRVD